MAWWSQFFFITYVFLYINQGFLIKLSSIKSGYQYDTKEAVMTTELIKLGLSFILYFRYADHDIGIGHWFLDLYQFRSLAYLYLVPALLSCIYDNLTYVNLGYYDPTTFFTLLQFRIVVDGLLHGVFFGKYLTKIQWLSLLLLTVGCIVKQWDNQSIGHLDHASYVRSLLEEEFQPAQSNLDYRYLLLILVQIMCSSLAAVYSEYLLKEGDGPKAPFMIHMAYLGFGSILCNGILLLATARDNEQLSPIMEMFGDYTIALIVVNGALCGLCTIVFLRTFDSIIQGYAFGLELVLTAILCMVIFDSSFNPITFGSIFLVSLAIYLYAHVDPH